VETVQVKRSGTGAGEGKITARCCDLDRLLRIDWGVSTKRVIRGALILGLVLAAPGGALAQAASTTGGGSRLHPVVGLWGGRLDLDDGPRIDLVGARAGVGFGELIQATGFYWRGVDTDEIEFVDSRGWGGELQLNLNAGFGVTPFLRAGVSRFRIDTLSDRTAATAGAGLMVPLGPLRFSVAATDHILGVGGLDSHPDDVETTHNWMFTVGASTVLGRIRSREVVAATPAPAPPPAARRIVVDTVAADTVVVTVSGEPGTTGPRNFQSDRRIEVPLPLEGSITIRYGPEPAPIITTAPAATPAPEAQASVEAPAAGAQPGAAPAPTVVLPQDPGDAATRRIVESAVAAILPRLEVRDAQRQAELAAALTAELRAALAAQREEVRELVRQEVARLQGLPVAPPPPPAAAPPAPADAALRAVQDRIEAARRELARLDEEPAAATERPATEAPGPETSGAEARRVLADLAAVDRALLSTAETPRGPALVVADAIFASGSALPQARARSIMERVGAALRDLPGVAVVVQGHTDNTGDEVANQQLSELRAEVVRSLLVQAGLEPGRVRALGFGAGQPVASNATPEGRALNRRVEIVVAATVSNGGNQ
jgi:outer membrane protein OmpA-like peptidoglycan-associated protein